MVTTAGCLLFLGGLTTLSVSVYAGYRIINNLLSRGVFNVENAEKLLELDRPEEWNALRLLNANWQPTLKSRTLNDLDLSGINFQRAKLEDIDFSRSILDDADFSMASMSKVNFSNTSLKQANFENAFLNAVTFDGASLENAAFVNVTLRDTVIPEGKTSQTRPVPGQDLLKLVAQDSETLSELTARQFEELVAEALRRSGYEAEVMGGPDKGIDILALRSDALGETVSIVECVHQRSDRPVGVPSIRALRGVSQLEGATRAILVTSGRFTNEARAVALQLRDIELIDREQLIKWIRTVI